MDEVTDVSHTEQVSFVVRYVHNMKIKKDLFSCATSRDALENLVMALLEDIRGQGYDGAAIRDCSPES